jgi:hypothetical protein
LGLGITGIAATAVSAAPVVLISATAALTSAAVLLTGIIAVIVLLAFAILEADALLADGDAFLGCTCVEGGTDDKDRSCNQQ